MYHWNIYYFNERGIEKLDKKSYLKNYIKDCLISSEIDLLNCIETFDYVTKRLILR